MGDFGFKELTVWQMSVDFAKEVILIFEHNSSERKHYRLFEQLESAVTSISSNIAEGKGRFSKKEFVQYLYIARGSLFETISIINVFYRLNWITEKELKVIENKATEIAKMLNALINSVKKTIN